MKEDFNYNPARPKQRGNYMITNFVTNYDDLGKSSIEHMIKHVESDSVDLFEKSESMGIFRKIATYLNFSNPLEWVFLLIFSVIITIFILLLDNLIILCFEQRRIFASSRSEIFNFIFWVFSAILFFLLATSVGYFISEDAEGSGIPEMKSVLSGINIVRYFSFNAFVGKVLGLFSIIVGGPSVGKVGPYVHISSLICSRLMKFSYFSKINQSKSSKNNMLAAAVAAGITLSLGTPLGAVLFSIESTASIYIVSNMWKSFFCAIICILMSKISGNTKTISLAEISSSKPIQFNSEVLLFIAEGVIGGIIGALISTLVAKIVYIRRKSKISLLENRFRYTVIIASIIGVVTYVLSFLRKTDKEIMNLTFANDETTLKSVMESNFSISLFAAFSLKTLLSVLAFTVNSPAGVFEPIFASGALFGRFYGHLVKSIFGLSDTSIYSLIGAACVFSGASHTLSSALIIFEMTGQTTYLSPLLLATLIANLTAQSLSMNIFDVLSAIKNLPQLSSIKSRAMYTLTSADIMTKVSYYMQMDKLTFINGMTILAKLPKRYAFVLPIIDGNGTIRFTIQVKNLYKYIHSEYEKVKLSYNVKNQNNFNEFFKYIHKKYFSVKRSFFQQIKHKFKKLYITIRDKQKVKLNKNFELESNWRLLTIIQDNSADDTVLLNKTFNLEDKILSADKSALTVDKNFPVLKIQFLFTFLNISHIFITDNGQMAGVITKEEFIKRSMSMN